MDTKSVSSSFYLFQTNLKKCLRQTMTSVGEHIQKLELSHIGVKGIKMVQPFGQNWEALK